MNMEFGRLVWQINPHKNNAKEIFKKCTYVLTIKILYKKITIFWKFVLCFWEFLFKWVNNLVLRQNRISNLTCFRNWHWKIIDTKVLLMCPCVCAGNNKEEVERCWPVGAVYVNVSRKGVSLYVAVGNSVCWPKRGLFICVRLIKRLYYFIRLFIKFSVYFNRNNASSRMRTTRFLSLFLLTS